jgi:hypothetical protein
LKPLCCRAISATAQWLFSFHLIVDVLGWLDSKPAPFLEKWAGAQEKDLWCERMAATSFTVFVKGAGFDFPAQDPTARMFVFRQFPSSILS